MILEAVRVLVRKSRVPLEAVSILEIKSTFRGLIGILEPKRVLVKALSVYKGRESFCKVRESAYKGRKSACRGS
jgi:hypothetical protein